MHPTKARPSLEACGIDVFALARDNGFDMDVVTGPITKLDIYGMVLVKNLSRLARGEAILEVGRKFASAGLSVYTPSGRAELIPPVYAFYSRYRTEGGPAFGSRNKK